MRDVALSSHRKTLFDVDTVVANVTKDLDSSYKSIRELDACLSDSREG